jgi:hypothetical protein
MHSNAPETALEARGGAQRVKLSGRMVVSLPCRVGRLVNSRCMARVPAGRKRWNHPVAAQKPSLIAPN